MDSLATWSQHPGPELPFLEVAPHFCSPWLRLLCSQTPLPAAFLEGRRGQLPPCPGLWPWSGPSLQEAVTGLGCRDVGNRTQDHICKSNKVESRAGRLGSAVCTGGSAGLRDAFLLLLWPEREIV